MYAEIQNDETVIDLDTLLEIRSGLVAFGQEAVGNTIEVVDDLIKEIRFRQKNS